MKKYKLRSGSDIYLDTLDNVMHSSDFESVLGKITSEFRFVPNGKICVEQGLTSEMLIAVSQLIKEKAGIGKKKAEPEKEDQPVGNSDSKKTWEKEKLPKVDPTKVKNIQDGICDFEEHTGHKLHSYECSGC